MCSEMFGTLAKNRSNDSFVCTLRDVKPMNCLVDVVAVLQDYIPPDMPYAPILVAGWKWKQATS
jgi:hypothetical protein